MIKQIALTGLEAAINQYIKLDPHSIKSLQTLAGKVVKLAFKGTTFYFFIVFGREGINLYPEYRGWVDTTLRGTPIIFIKMGMPGTNQVKQMFSGEVEIEGDTELGQEIKKFLNNIEIDWEEHLSHYLGDVVAHQIGNVVRSARSWGKKNMESLRKDTTEYLQEEIRYFPCREEIEDFYKEVDSLRMDIDRLEARIILLSKSAHKE